MKKSYTKTIWGSIFAISFLISCESATPSLMEFDENGNKVDNSDINIQKTIVDIGIKGFSIDSLYTEFIFTETENPRIKSFRKGIAKFESNGKLKSITYKDNANIIHDEFFSYVCNGLKSEMVLNTYGFVEEKVNRDSNGQIHSRILYRYDYDNGGYLKYVHLERPGHDRVTIYYTYPDENGDLSIREGTTVYRIPMTKNKIENQGYVCSVFSLAKAPLTNQYVINPDLYYFGIYGTPIKYLPDVLIENGVITRNGSIKHIIVKVDNHRFFYK